MRRGEGIKERTVCGPEIRGLFKEAVREVEEGVVVGEVVGEEEGEEEMWAGIAPWMVSRSPVEEEARWAAQRLWAHCRWTAWSLKRKLCKG